VVDGEMTLEHGIERAVFASRQLAKRQLTWLRSLDNVMWLDSDKKNISNQALSHIKAAGLAADLVI
jgi:tRNA dimethylallyltransferase